MLGQREPHRLPFHAATCGGCGAHPPSLLPHGAGNGLPLFSCMRAHGRALLTGHAGGWVGGQQRTRLQSWELGSGFGGPAPGMEQRCWCPPPSSVTEVLLPGLGTEAPGEAQPHPWPCWGGGGQSQPAYAACPKCHAQLAQLSRGPPVTALPLRTAECRPSAFGKSSPPQDLRA